MSDPLVTTFGGKEVAFSLPMKWVMVVERECGDKSIVTMFQEMDHAEGETDKGLWVFHFLGAVRVKDVYEVIRCAAIGGGMSPTDAATLVNEYVDGRPYAETVPVAWAILRRTLLGTRLKKKEEEAESPELTTAEQ